MRPQPILPPPAPPRPKRRRRRSWILSFLGFGFASMVFLFVGGAAVAGYLLWKASKDLPSSDSLARYEPPVMTRIHAHDGALIAEYARERRIFVPIGTVPELLINCFLSAEDRRFYEHNGLDFTGIGRAAVKFVEAKMKGKGSIQGASTITQQVAKNFLLSSERTFDRKLREAILAIRIEQTYSKAKILELYLNEIYFGIGSYGIAAAALNYFDKELDELTLEEAAYLAALPKGPNNYHPYRKTAAAIERRNWIIDQMVANGHATPEAAKEAKAKPLKVNIRPFGTQIFAADYFAEEVRRWLVGKFGEDKLLTGGLSVRTTLDPKLQQHARRVLIDGLVSFDRTQGWRGPVQRIELAGDWGATLGGLDVPTDLAPWRLGVVLEVQKAKIVVGLRPPKRPDGKLEEQRQAVEIGFDEMRWAGKHGPKPESPKGPAPRAPADVVGPGDVVWVAPKEPGKPTGVWSLMQIPEVGGGIVAMDPHTGRVLAIVGGFSFAMSQFDRAAQAKRQPGSTFKPIVYATAIDNGYKPTSIVLDAPIEIEQGPGKEAWRPENYNKSQSLGPATLRVGIEKSRNQMTARLGQDMGMPVIVEYARRFGIYDDLAPLPAMVLGAGETTLLRMVGGYAMLANGGRKITPTLVDRIQDRWGKSVWKHDNRQCPGCKSERWGGQQEPELTDERTQIIDPHTAYQMTSILEGVVQRGTATIVKKMVPNVPFAGKTGTSNDSKDVWFVGYTPDLAVGVFVGYDTPTPMGKAATGGQVAAPIFASFMKLALADKKPVPFRIPPGVKLVRVNAKTGLRSSPEDADTILEAFKPNEEPDDQYSVIGFNSGEQSSATAAEAERALVRGPGFGGRF
ncbi:MAG: penicillin-binding protein 1A [Hyphomicrobiaceae bacterium]|nr:penicillin-binding protein 1A [Hyphomicrobiaceae bacterium]